MSNKKIFLRAFKNTIPVLTGYLMLGFGFGMILKAKGLSLIWALVMSLTMYSGSMQYAGVGLIAGGASYFTIAITTLMVNARHLFYGISLIDKYKNTGLKKLYLMFALTDETYSLIVSENEDMPENKKPLYYFFVTLLDHIYWISGGLLGALTGTVVKFNTKGLDFVLTALFVTIFTEQWMNNKKHFPALSGMAISLIFLIIFGADKFLIPAMAAILAVLMIAKHKVVKNDE